MSTTIKSKEDVFATLPKPRKESLLSDIIAARKIRSETIIVLDDDPTGTQTVFDVPVLTRWDTSIISQEFKRNSPLFFILTNSRSLTLQEAKELAYEIGKNIKEAADELNKSYLVISRSDSTLRGHYPCELAALASGLQLNNNVQFLIPAFFEGGRYTINNVHYVEQGEALIPAAQTTYANDKVFGYKNSDLTDWVIEKNDGSISKADIATISIEELRNGELSALINKLNRLKHGVVCIVNAASYQDLYFLSLAILKSEVSGIFRSAASFVTTIAGLEIKPLLTSEVITDKLNHGGLIVVGSYVPTTTGQLMHLLSSNPEVKAIEIDVTQVLQLDNISVLIDSYVKQINEQISSGKTIVIYTSRNQVIARSDQENQSIGKQISSFLTSIVSEIEVYPKYLLTKGGITASDIATKSLGIQRAIVKGQIIPGVPVWQLGNETKFPDRFQIIFPGNVGGDGALTEVVNKLNH